MEHLATPARFHAAHEAIAAASSGAVQATAGLPAAGPDEVLASLGASLCHQLPPPAAALQACVVIPAKDEVATLPATLAALAAQTTLGGERLPASMLEVIVLANNCHDGTAAAVRHAMRRHPDLALHVVELTLPAGYAHVGCARRLLLDAATQRLAATSGPRGVLLTTDADTIAAPTWVAANLHELAQGAEAVGGRILTQTPPAAAPCPVRRLQLYDAAYRVLLRQLEDRLDPIAADRWPCHHQHYGASLALTVQAYQQAGGMPLVPFLEDEALWQRLCALGLPVRHSPHPQVYTSPRRCGRVEVGLSWQLREWEHLTAQNQELHVPDPHELVRTWRARRRLRAWYQQGARAASPELARLAQTLGVPAPQLAQQGRASAAFGRLWQWVEETRGPVAAVPVAGALRDLRRYLREGVPGAA